MDTRTLLRQHGVALRAMLVFTVVLGVAYTAVVTGIGQLALGREADQGETAIIQRRRQGLFSGIF